MFVEGYAEWRRSIVSENGQEIGSDINKIDIPVCEYQPKTHGVGSLSTFELNNATYALRTNDTRAEDMVQDDEITYKNITYSVSSVQALRSAAYLGAKEYVIWLH